jgi:hypothetical protein
MRVIVFMFFLLFSSAVLSKPLDGSWHFGNGHTVFTTQDVFGLKSFDYIIFSPNDYPNSVIAEVSYDRMKYVVSYAGRDSQGYIFERKIYTYQKRESAASTTIYHYVYQDSQFFYLNERLLSVITLLASFTDKSSSCDNDFLEIGHNLVKPKRSMSHSMGFRVIIPKKDCQ